MYHIQKKWFYIINNTIQYFITDLLLITFMLPNKRASIIKLEARATGPL